MYLLNNKLGLLFYVFLSVIIVVSCSDDDPVAPEEEHFEAIGTVIYDGSGAVAVSILRGETDDTLYIEKGNLSDHFTVKFYDEGENIVDPPDEEHTSLSYEIGNEELVEWYQHEGEEGGYEFHLRGMEQGTTTLELFLMHGDHHDYRSGKIPVKIN